jgi:large exoprotein involved in heme utilization and adhesion
VELIGASADSLFSSGLFSNSAVEATGDAGNLTINTGQLIIRDGATVSSAAEATGNAGNLTINAEQLIIRDGGRVSSETYGRGRGGDLTVSASRSVELTGTTPDGFPSSLYTRSQGIGNAGNLTINTGQLIVRDGAQAASTTFGQGSGGNLSVSALQSVELIGTSAKSASGLFASAIVGDGAGGDLRITSPELIVRDGAVVSVSNFQSRNQAPPGTGPAGNLQIQAGTIRLDNQGTITAAAAGGDKGNITIESQDIQMRRGSAITTNATGLSAGGNIIINTDTLVALENSDITANALNNRGGNVTINAQGIFGTEFRPQLTPNSDITATGAEGLNGVVQINTPDVDPSSGLVELPTTVVDVESLVAKNLCTSQKASSSFVVTGRGGLPPSPNDPLTDETVMMDWSRPGEVQGSQGAEEPRREVSLQQSADNTQRKNRVVQQVQGWRVAPDGTIILTAQAPTATPQSPSWIHPGCYRPQPQ